MHVKIKPLSPGRWDNEPDAGTGLTCRDFGRGVYHPVNHDWQLMQAPPDPIWWCRRCQRIEQHVLVR